MIDPRRLVVYAVCVVTGLAPAAPSLQAQSEHLELKWVRDAEEFAVVVEQIYLVAAASVQRQVASAAPDGPWAVVLDVDETALETSTYQLELAAYGSVYDTLTWHPYVERRSSPPLPGVARFLSTVRELGGRVAFVTDRAVSVFDATRDNLAAFGLYRPGDLLCLLDPATPAYAKAARRGEVRSGTGRCAWQGEPVTVLAYVGDSMKDLPTAEEDAAALGERAFLLPNPTYGSWTTRVTRPR